MASGEPSDNPPRLPRGLIGRTGTPAAKGGRLPSIRAPRDLTLGGIPKKVFAPNLAARREKPKEISGSIEVTPAKSEVRDKHKKDNNKVRPGNGRGRGRGKDIIQSHSIFEQGPTEKLLPKGGSGYGESMRRESAPRSGVPSQSLAKQRTDERTKKILDQLLSDDFVDYVDEEDHQFDPIRLPLASVVKREIKTEVGNVKIKAEPTLDDEGMHVDRKPADKVVTQTSVTTFRSPDDLVTCSQLFTTPSKSEEGELLFLQLPNILPGTPSRPLTQTHSDKSVDKTNTDKDTEKDIAKNNSCSLRDFSEGLIGKLVIRKSGRTQLLLGNITLDVSMGTPCAFLQDLASIRTSGDSGDMSVLGHIQHRLVCTPDFSMLLNTAT